MIKKEFTAQLRAFIDKFEMKPSHIDGHNHVHMREPVANIVAGVMA